MTRTLTALKEARSLDELYGVFNANRYTAGWHKKRPSLWSEPNGTFTAFELGAGEDALLFEVSDEPTLRMLGFFRNDE